MNAKHSPLSLLAVLILGLFLLSGVRADNLILDNSATNLYQVGFPADPAKITQGFNLSADVNVSQFSMGGLLTTGMMWSCYGQLLKGGDGSFIANLNFGMAPTNTTNITFTDLMSMPLTHVALAANVTPDAYLINATCNGMMGGAWGFDGDVYSGGTMWLQGTPKPTNDTNLVMWGYAEPPPAPVPFTVVEWGSNPTVPLTITEGDPIPAALKCTSSASLMMGSLKLYANFSGWAPNVTQSSPANGSFYNWTITGAPAGTWLLGGYCETDPWGMGGPSNWTATNRTVTVEAAAPPTTIPAEEEPLINTWGLQTGNFITSAGPSVIQFILAIGIVLAVLAMIWGIVEMIGVTVKHGPRGTEKAGTKMEKRGK